MFIRKTALTYFVLCVFVFSAFAQKQALSRIDKKDLKKHLTFIASDDLQGRELGTEVNGLEITANYLAENAQRIGLKPGSENYFQTVALVSTKPAKDNIIEVLDKGEKSLYKSNKLVNLSKGTDEIFLKNESIVVAGFGYYSSVCL